MPPGMLSPSVPHSHTWEMPISASLWPGNRSKMNFVANPLGDMTVAMPVATHATGVVLRVRDGGLQKKRPTFTHLQVRSGLPEMLDL